MIISQEFEDLKKEEPLITAPIINAENFFCSIPEDPSLVGLFTMSTNLSTVQNKKDNLVRIYNQYKDAAVEIKNYVNKVKRLVEKERATILSTDPVVSTLKNQPSQEAYTNKQMEDLLDFQSGVSNRLSKINTEVEKCFALLENLQSTNENISRQVSVVSAQIQIGEVSRLERPLDRYKSS